MLTASIITIGDELLIGQVIDTNSAWIAQQLNKSGIPVLRRVAVGDNEKEIWASLKQEETVADVILITGGLGPTSDDITKPILCKYFNGKLILNEEALKNVEYLFKEIFKKEATAINLKQAEVPDVCEVIPNKRGTAPGMWFEKEGKIFISMPGVPFEMQGMITDYIIPRITERFSLPAISHQTLLTSGVGESVLASMLSEFELSLPTNIKLAYLPAYGMVRLRLSSTGFNIVQLENEVKRQFEKMKSLVSEFLVTDLDESLSQVIGKLLLKLNKTVCTAESCTGGFIAHQLTLNAGASNYFKGSIISYDNEVKKNMLMVSETTLKEFGAVSEETVIQMNKGVIAQLKTDYSIAVSGIMGPGGGSEEKPVGTVWIAVGNKKEIVSKKFHLRFDRVKNIEITSQYALDMLRKFILKSSESTYR